MIGNFAFYQMTQFFVVGMDIFSSFQGRKPQGPQNAYCRTEEYKGRIKEFYEN